MRILVADDEKGVRELLARVIEREGYEAVVVPDGNECLERLNREDYDMVIADLKMPLANGLEVLEGLPEYRRRPAFILATGYPTLGTVMGLVEKGGHDYLVKPFDVEVVKEMIRNCLRRRKEDLQAVPGQGVIDFLLDQMSHTLNCDLAFFLVSPGGKTQLAMRFNRAVGWEAVEMVLSDLVRALRDHGGPAVDAAEVQLNVSWFAPRGRSRFPRSPEPNLVAAPLIVKGQVSGLVGIGALGEFPENDGGPDYVAKRAAELSRVLDSRLAACR